VSFVVNAPAVEAWTPRRLAGATFAREEDLSIGQPNVEAERGRRLVVGSGGRPP